METAASACSPCDTPSTLTQGACRWVAYMLGACIVLAHELSIAFPQGLSLLVSVSLQLSLQWLLQLCDLARRRPLHS